jgi:hypothetical protein
MDALQFAYWLQGFSELSGDTPPTPEQWESIQEHLQTVFKKVTPPVNTPAAGWPPGGLGPLVSPNIPDPLKPIVATC